jgi:DHA1 family multidrug resistance protein-like MFS transporter
MNGGTERGNSARKVFWVSFAALTLALMGFKFEAPFLPLYLQELGVPVGRLPLWSGLLDFTEEIATVVAAPIWGVLGDRFGRKAMAVRAMLGGVLVIMLITIAPNAYVVLALMFLSGLLTGVVSPLNALVASVTPAEDLSRVMGRLLAVVFFTNAVGPLVGGAIADEIGYRGAFLTGAGLLAVAAALVGFLLREPVAGPGPAVKAPRGLGLAAQLSRVLRVPGFAAFWVSIGLLDLSGFLLYPIMPVLVPTLEGIVHRGGEAQIATSVGLALGISGVTAMAASWKAHAVVTRFGIGPTLFACTSVGALIVSSMFVVDSFWGIVLLQASAGFFIGTAHVALSPLVGVLVPSELYSTAYGLTASMQSAATALGFLGGGLIGFVLGLHAVFVVSGVLLGAVAVLAVTSLRKHRVSAVESLPGR